MSYRIMFIENEKSNHSETLNNIYIYKIHIHTCNNSTRNKCSPNYWLPLECICMVWRTSAERRRLLMSTRPDNPSSNPYLPTTVNCVSVLVDNACDTIIATATRQWQFWLYINQQQNSTLTRMQVEERANQPGNQPSPSI